VHPITVLSAVRALHELGQLKIIHLQWIKGHNGRAENKMANFIPKSGSRLIVEGREPFLPLPTVQVKAIAAAATYKAWAQEWADHKHCRQTNIFFPSPDPSRSRDLLCNS
jgi:hypothetical protein